MPAIVSTPSISRGPGRTISASPSKAHTGTPGNARDHGPRLVGRAVEVEPARRHQHHVGGGQAELVPGRLRRPAPGPRGHRDATGRDHQIGHPVAGGEGRVHPLDDGDPRPRCPSTAAATPASRARRSPTSAAARPGTPARCRPPRWCRAPARGCRDRATPPPPGSRGSPGHRRPGRTAARTPGTDPGSGSARVPARPARRRAGCRGPRRRPAVVARTRRSRPAPSPTCPGRRPPRSCRGGPRAVRRTRTSRPRAGQPGRGRRRSRSPTAAVRPRAWDQCDAPGRPLSMRPCRPFPKTTVRCAAAADLLASASIGSVTRVR